MGKGVNIGVTDTTKLLYYDQGADLKLSVKAGDTLPKGCLPYLAIKYGRRVAANVPETIFGLPVTGVSVPVKVGGRVIGSCVISRPMEIMERQAAGNHLFGLAGPAESEAGGGRKKESNDAGGAAFQSYTFKDLIFCSKGMERLMASAKKISLGQVSVLIQGESGTGKEIIAQAIHNYNPRRRGPFIAVNCAAMPRELIQSELFGYEDGAFTGARKGGKEGLFELANGGTIFLDEIGDMPLLTQANLLRVLQERKTNRIGGYRVVPLDVRVIAATNKNLKERIERGLFRQDLFYRISATVLSIPPLRERREDIAVLLRHFIAKYSSSQGCGGEICIAPAAERLLTDYHWPGNVRELENTVVGILNVLEGPTIKAADLPAGLRPGMASASDAESLHQVEKKVIIEALIRYSGNLSLAAKALGISRPTLYRKMKKYQITS